MLSLPSSGGAQRRGQRQCVESAGVHQGHQNPVEQGCEKAKNTYEMVGLGNIPIQKDDKDRRATSRNSAFIKARESLEGWRQIKDAPETYKSVMKTQIMITAVAEGFFSVWMTVFADEPQILQALIESFPGTNGAYYGKDGKIKKIM